MPAEVLAIIAAAEAVRAQSHQPAGEPRGKLVRHYLHVIAGRYDGSFRAVERDQNVRTSFLLGRMQTVPALGSQRLAAKLVVAGYAPDVGLDAVLLRKDALGAQRLV